MFVSTEDRTLLRCSKCKALKPPVEFAWHRKARGERDCYCRPCRAAYKRAHYLTYRQRYIDQATARKSRLILQRTRFLIEYFRTHPCRDCGETDPVVLEFDHLRDKQFDIGAALWRRNWESILAEMEKCEVVCANCHRRRTSRRRGALRVVLTQGN
jgi:hypothetical protein